MKQLYYEVKKCLGCKSCEIACSIAHSGTGELFSAIKEEVLSLPRKKVLHFKDKNYPVSCRHCKDPKCVDACMAAALIYDKEKGMVVHDESRCVGCWMCVMVCPYSAIRPNIKTKIPLRCDKCKDVPRSSSKSEAALKEERGEDELSCVRACPTQAIIWQEEISVEK